ncbi:lactate utilization protein C [Promicromonospora thailandica]|uniref:L-lactate dehydrogenase complex protein LldG n=1 Tax=Promicromonospora thailandica TaxID=765201 RepID=A0A9X2FYB1_9MICO|nr:LUD domain-containing protein [Promicromonospora thailandica]MCP2263605.1 L-lactate dehydrogenase complex protein LldG [Promicromonospora thailandica]BFF19204.1 LUD domain-containing protein [Promicromonospora thailandica]
MSDARSEILSRVRDALGAAAPTPARIPRAYRPAGEHAAGSDEVLDLLVDRLEDYRAHVHRVTAAGLPGLLADLLGGTPGRVSGRVPGAAPARGARSAVVVPPGLDPAWLAGLADVDVRADTRDAPLAATELDEVGAVVTAARVAVAETGTIVLDGEPDQGRRAISLVPDVHVCVVRTSQVVQTVPEAVRLLDAHPERPLTWISGPSATSDIELDRVEGVHGPRTLHVVLVR